MSRQTFVDFKAVKAAITIEQVLDHYDLLPRYKRSGDSLSGPCPIHGGESATQFRVSISKSIWNCFSQCKRGGNVLDFISGMEGVSIHEAALKAIEWFGLNLEAMQVNDQENEKGDVSRKAVVSKRRSAPEKAVTTPEKTTPNPPLKFRLDKLDPTHRYLEERGLTEETIVEFGIGFCAKGILAGRIAIPIQDVEGSVVAYAGRLPGEPDEEHPKYKLPPGFRKLRELFNLHRVVKEPADRPLVIVEGFFDCMALHQNGCPKVVALMGSTMSTAQEALIRQHTTEESQIIVMLDENEAGKAGRDDIASRLSKWCFVKVYSFDAPATEPEHLSAEEVKNLLGGAN